MAFKSNYASNSAYSKSACPPYRARDYDDMCRSRLGVRHRRIDFAGEFAIDELISRYSNQCLSCLHARRFLQRYATTSTCSYNLMRPSCLQTFTQRLHPSTMIAALVIPRANFYWRTDATLWPRDQNNQVTPARTVARPSSYFICRAFWQRELN